MSARQSFLYTHKAVICCLALLMSISLSAGAQQSDEDAILAIMDHQIRCWNQGNLDCFMKGYWQSDSLMFIGKSGITYGYDQTLARYKKTYPDRKAMGSLTFDILQLQRLSEDAYFMIGKWMLKREEDTLDGHFTLLFRNIDGHWVIVKDHSS